MKLFFKIVYALFFVVVGFIIANWSSTPADFKEVIGTISAVDTVNNTYTLKVGEELFVIETELPLPKTNMQIILALPK
jgi:hypothetical protein